MPTAYVCEISSIKDESQHLMVLFQVIVQEHVDITLGAFLD